MKKVTPSTTFANYLTALVLGLVPFHAFLTVFGSTLVGHYTVLRLWDAGALLALAGITGFWLVREPTLRRRFFASPLARIISVYMVLTIALGLVALLKHEVTLKALGFALVVNLRFLVWFLAVYVTASRSDWLRLHWKRLVLWPALVVCLFALVQFFVLPPKFLAHFGYDSLKNVAPVTTINQSSATVRVQSFLRGPNPLGAYLVMVLGLVVLFLGKLQKDWRTWLLGGLAGLTLLLTFSRSAWIGAVATGLGALLLRLKTRRAQLQALAVVVAVLVLGLVGILALSSKTGVQDAFLHATPESHLKETSNQGHSIALRQSVNDLVHEPFGRGPGTAGPASLYNKPHPPRNSENYFLEIGLDTGWAGLLLFGAINVLVGYELWLRRTDRLAVAVFVTLLGLTVVNQFAYAWADDTLAFVWWGLAGIALGQQRQKEAL